MPRPMRPLLLFAAALGASGHACADSFNARTGAWEMTTTSVVTGMPVPAEKLAQMAPGQRAKFEAAMKARSGQAQTHTYQHCMTQKDLDQNRMLKSTDADDKCTKKVVSKSAARIVIEQTCPAPRASTAQMSFEAKSPESLVASIDMVQDGATGRIHVDVAGRWLAASCAGIKGKD